MEDIKTGENVVRVDFCKKKSLKSYRASDLQEMLDQNKYELFREWLEIGAVCVLFDARLPAVKVPPEFKEKGDLRLNFCHDFQIVDFNFNKKAVFGTLSFDSGEFFCLVPWESVFGIQSAKLHKGAVWFEDFPRDYDQVEVLGFNESMCLGDAGPDETISVPEPMMNNVIELDFSKK